MQVKTPFGKTQPALKEPSSDYDQATKKYVDDSIVNHRNDTSVHLTLAQNVWLSGINATQAEINYLSGVTSSVQGQLNAKLSLDGGTMTGPLVLSANPTLNLGAATKQYVDTADAASKDRANHTGTQPISSVTDLQNQLNQAKGLGTGLSTQDPNLATEHVILSNHANTPDASFYWHITTTFWSTMDSNSNRGQIAVQYNGGASVYARSCYSGVWTAWQRLDNAGVSASQISTGTLPDGRLSGTYTNANIGGNAATAAKLQTARTINGVNFDGSSDITVADSTKLPITGGVMTGFLTLHAAPTDNMHAATKKYVDDTMVGISYGVATTTTDGLMSSIDKVKLNGIATSATANQTDAYLTNRANHTGTQEISTVSGLQAALNSKLAVAGGELTGMLKTRMSSDSAVSLTAVVGSSSLQVMGDNTRGAWMSFHRANAYAINLGLDTDNIFKLGGWSSGDGNAAFSCTGGGNFQPKASVSFPSMLYNTNSGSAVTINFRTAQKQALRLTAACSVTFDFPGVGNYQLIIEQDGVGNRTLSYAQSGVNFVGSDTAPALNTAPWSQTILSVFWSGSAIYIAGSKVNAA